MKSDIVFSNFMFQLPRSISLSVLGLLGILVTFRNRCCNKTTFKKETLALFELNKEVKD